jgi:predicted ester cyclase
MSVEANKAIVRRLFEVWNSGKLDAIEELYAPDYVADYRPYAPLIRGHAGIKGMVQRAFAAFPDYHEELEQLVAEGEMVAVRLTITGTHLGWWGVVAPTGKKVRFEEILILRIVGGKVVEQRGIVDNLAALRQLGVVSSPPAASADPG